MTGATAATGFAGAGAGVLAAGAKLAEADSEDC